MLPASARCTRSGSSARLAAHAASSAQRQQQQRAARSTRCQQRAARSTRCQQRALPASSSTQQPALAGSVACARSTRWHRLRAQQTARAASVASSASCTSSKLRARVWSVSGNMAAGGSTSEMAGNSEQGIDWKRNLFNILTAKGSKYVLTQPCPPEPSLYDYRNQREPYEKWCEANKMAKRYILASISVELYKKHRSMETATEIMGSLHHMFGQNTHFAREAALKRITDTKMEEGTKVRDHVLKMMDYLNEVEIHGVQINDKSKINMVIESLPDTFKEFKKNFIIAENFLKKDSLQGLSRKTRMSKQELGSENCPLKEVASQKASVTNVDRRVTGRKIVLRLLKSEQEEQQQPADQYRIILEQPSLLEPRRSGRIMKFGKWMSSLPFLNGHLEENIYMQQPDGFIQKGQEHMVCKLQRSIYGLKQASRSWNIRFDQAIKSFGFIQNIDEPCVYKKIQEKFVTFLILYVDDILLIGNDIGVLTTIKSWLAKQFDMKDLGEASYILGIKLLRDRKNKTLALSQAVYIDKILARFSMENSKTGLLPFRHGITFSKDQSPKTSEEIERMRRVPYATAVGSLMYAMLCTRPDICFAVWMVSRYQFNPGPQYWTAVKHIIKYLKRTKNYMLVYSGDELIPVGYTDSDFKSDRDSRKSTSGYVFALGSGAISWMSVKQSCITDSITKAEYVATSEAAKEAIWLCKFLRNLEVFALSTNSFQEISGFVLMFPLKIVRDGPIANSLLVTSYNLTAKQNLRHSDEYRKGARDFVYSAHANSGMDPTYNTWVLNGENSTYSRMSMQYGDIEMTEIYQITQKYQRGQVRGLGFRATPTQLEAHIRSTGKVKELQNQLQAQSERMSVLEKNYEHLTAALLKQCQQNPSKGFDDIITSQACTPQSQQGSSTMQENGHYENARCYLLNWYSDDVDEIVAEGTIASTDPKAKVHHMPLGRDCWKVWVESIFDGMDEVTLYKVTDEAHIVVEALGSTVAWPKSCIKLF
ncbi:Integrase catalytic domain-containing protein [Citrus sinensis]|nr:Integrase catalytic domain-containing protein [Citrus sinensis]